MNFFIIVVLSVVLLCGSGIQGDEFSTLQSTQPINTDRSIISSRVNPQLILAKLKNHPIVLDKLLGNEHGIKSDNIRILNITTISIPNFYYDGNAPDAHFMIGKGNEPNKNGLFVPDDIPLPSFNGQTYTITLPGNLTVDQFDWLAVWCASYQTNLGSIYFNFKQLEYPPQTFPFKHLVTSGPVVLVNKKTLFIPNLSYDGEHKDVHFWIGNGTEADANGVLVSDETGSEDNLKVYQGENIYIKLPPGYTTDNIDYFAIWSKTEQISLGYVAIANISNVPEETLHPETRTADGREILRLPKCCPVSQILTDQGCAYESASGFQPQLNIYKHNTTHIENVPLDIYKFRFEPYIFSMTCRGGKYPLDEKLEQVGLLENGSLIVKKNHEGKGLQGILSQGQYCMEAIDDNNQSFPIFALVCAPEEVEISKAFFSIYTAFLVISTLCFALIAIIYCLIWGCQDIHKKCFLFYSSWMCITFLCLIVVQVAYIENDGCNVIGFFFQFSMISAFTWLAIICYDIYYIVNSKLIYIKYVKGEDTTIKRIRFWYYLAIAIGTPVIFLIISLARNLIPDVPDSFFKPQYGGNTCYFEEENQRKILFYVPIAISIFISFGTLGYAKYKIMYGDRRYGTDYHWLEKAQDFKFVHTRYMLVAVTMLLWLIEGLCALGQINGGIATALEIIEAAQGIFLILLFVANSVTKKQIHERIRKKHSPEFPMELLSLTNNTKNGQNGIIPNYNGQ